MKPNVLDIAKESIKLKNLADYPALLASVCTIGGLYLLLMIWARKKDKKDILDVSRILFSYFCNDILASIHIQIILALQDWSPSFPLRACRELRPNDTSVNRPVGLGVEWISFSPRCCFVIVYCTCNFLD